MSINNKNNIEEVMEEYDDSNGNIMVLDKITEKIIEELNKELKAGSLDSDRVKVLSKVLKNITSSKKNILKADLLNIELDDCLYDEYDFDEEDDEEPIEFEEDEEVEEIKPSKSSSKKKSKN